MSRIIYPSLNPSKLQHNFTTVAKQIFLSRIWITGCELFWTNSHFERMSLFIFQLFQVLILLECKLYLYITTIPIPNGFLDELWPHLCPTLMNFQFWWCVFLIFRGGPCSMNQWSWAMSWSTVSWRSMIMLSETKQNEGQFKIENEKIMDTISG